MSKEKIKVYLYTRVSKIEVTMEPDEESIIHHKKRLLIQRLRNM